MKKIKIPNLTKELSVLGLGTMIFAPNKKELSFGILDNFVDNGGTLIDTAEIYGDPEQYGYSEATIGMWFESRRKREEVVLLTKGCIPNSCKPIHPEGLEISPRCINTAIEGSLKRLKTDYIDIWLLHRDDTSKEVGPIVEALNQQIRKGNILSYGGSNWTRVRIDEANTYAKEKGLIGMSASSPHFCLANTIEPYFGSSTVETSKEDKEWHIKNNFPLFAWSALGRGFFAKGDRNFDGDPNLVRVYYSEENFEKLRRAEELGKAKGLTRAEIAIAYVVNQKFPVSALVGPSNNAHMLSCIKGANGILSDKEIQWLELKIDKL